MSYSFIFLYFFHWFIIFISNSIPFRSGNKSLCRLATSILFTENIYWKWSAFLSSCHVRIVKMHFVFAPHLYFLFISLSQLLSKGSLYLFIYVCVCTDENVLGLALRSLRSALPLLNSSLERVPKGAKLGLHPYWPSPPRKIIYQNERISEQAIINWRIN